MREQSLNFEDAAKMEGLLGATFQPHNERFGTILGNIMSALMAIALMAVFFYFIWGAFDWLTSSGDKGKLEGARNKMMHAAIGVIILSSVTALFMLVQYILGLNVVTFPGSASTGSGTTTPSVTQPVGR